MIVMLAKGIVPLDLEVDCCISYFCKWPVTMPLDDGSHTNDNEDKSNILTLPNSKIKPYHPPNPTYLLDG